MKFYVMDNDRPVSVVTVLENEAKVVHFFSGVMYPFYKADTVPISAVTAFFESRCFDQARPDKEGLLHAIGLDTYNPWEIVKKTKGRMMHDHLWIDIVKE